MGSEVDRMVRSLTEPSHKFWSKESWVKAPVEITLVSAWLSTERNTSRPVLETVRLCHAPTPTGSRLLRIIRCGHNCHFINLHLPYNTDPVPQVKCKFHKSLIQENCHEISLSVIPIPIIQKEPFFWSWPKNQLYLQPYQRGLSKSRETKVWTSIKFRNLN